VSEINSILLDLNVKVVVLLPACVRALVTPQCKFCDDDMHTLCWQQDRCDNNDNVDDDDEDDDTEDDFDKDVVDLHDVEDDDNDASFIATFLTPNVTFDSNAIITAIMTSLLRMTS
jgi:hypothetical protein